jgi:opacity protein-like surface antigen
MEAQPMKKFTTFAAMAALLAGVSLASAQNAPTSGVKPAPDSINRGALPDKQSGNESMGTAQSDKSGMATSKVTGKSKFCIEQGIGGGLNCNFASMAACQKEAKGNDYQCLENPNLGTTGAK